MPELSSGFLRFEVAGQAFAMSMAHLAGIRQLGETQSGQADSQPGMDVHTYVAPIDLSSLFFGKPSEDPDGFIVVVRAERYMYVLRVDRVRAGTSLATEERQALPPIIGALDSPFNGIFHDPDGWGLIIDANRLAELIHKQYDEQAVEHLYEFQ